MQWKIYSGIIWNLCQYLSADICHMRCNALDSLPGRVLEQYDSDCSAGNSDPFAIALLLHKDQGVSELGQGFVIMPKFSTVNKNIFIILIMH